MPKLQHNQRQQKGASPFRSLQSASWRMFQKNSCKAERLDRKKSEVIKETLADEMQRVKQKKEKSITVTTAAPAPKLATSHG